MNADTDVPPTGNLLRGMHLDPDAMPRLLHDCLSMLWERRGTDVHVSAGTPVMLRIDGKLEPAPGCGVLTGADTDAVISALLGPVLTERLWAVGQVDFSLTWAQAGRLRGNAYLQKGTVALALRLLTLEIPTMEALGLPASVQAWASLPRGLVLVTGATGSGKSTTLASILGHINGTQQRHLVTIEDPIEYVHTHRRGLVNQREVGADTVSFADGLRAVLREDPDVLLIGEMRDPESIQAALTIAETGHLVFATLHTNDSSQTFDRIVDVFTADRQPQIRLQLAHTLCGVLHQQLIPRIGGGRVAAFDVLQATQAVRNLVREGKTRQIRNVVLTGMRDGMQTLESSLSALVIAGVVDYWEAVQHSMYPAEIEGGRSGPPAMVPVPGQAVLGQGVS
jgi:twitching motility protein PilT